MERSAQGIHCPAFKTIEFIAYVVITFAVLIASLVANGNDDNGAGGDYFRADRAWFSVVLLTIGYMVSRGLAKSGSREHAPGWGRRRSHCFSRSRRTFPWMS